MSGLKKDLITVAEACEMLGMSATTIIRYFDNGELKGIAKSHKTNKRIRRSIWIERSGVENFFKIPEDATL